MPSLEEKEAEKQAAQLSKALGVQLYPRSLTGVNGAILFLTRHKEHKRLGVIASPGNSTMALFRGSEQAVEMDRQALTLKWCPTDHANADALRQVLPFLRPRTLGLALSAGFGDRLGLATPGHVRAVRGTGIAPVFAQQSIREMTRTQRTPQQVMDDAMWGVFQEGWREGFGADADHLKIPADVDACVAVGFTFYTIDPGDHVDNAAHTDPPDVLVQKVEGLPWDDLESSPQAMRRTYLDRSFALTDGSSLAFDEVSLLRAAAKYGKAIAHTTRMYRHLATHMGDRPFELEVSVDETETPTTHWEHLFIANELKRLDVHWVSLAPRYIGRFEKGVDYIGDLDAFEANLARHVAIMRTFGPYKLSIHSGSDKFSIYPVFARQAGRLVHLKTAGTSYLEALRAVAGIDPGLFREILAFAFERYDEDKATYHVSADSGKVPQPDQLADDELASVLDLFDGRQLLHVTFGSVLTAKNEDGSYRFRSRLLAALQADERAHYAALEQHFRRHLEPFT
ncbi:MAG TPA: hypothetical protein EYH31_09280 [Anaerolineae bacterium]|nr:hypothetical protein [Anaerolineae bacterium]